MAFQSTLPKWAATRLWRFWAYRPKFQSTLPKWAATIADKCRRYLEWIFQSTLPKWAATNVAVRLFRGAAISIHAAQVGSDDSCGDYDVVCGNISIHAAQVGSDGIKEQHSRLLNDFNPRCPSGQRPLQKGMLVELACYFNPRCPSGQRPAMLKVLMIMRLFQSTLPKWAATLVVQKKDLLR